VTNRLNGSLIQPCIRFI